MDGVEQVELLEVLGVEWLAEKDVRLKPLTVCANPDILSASPALDSFDEEVLSPESEMRLVLASLTLS